MNMNMILFHHPVTIAALAPPPPPSHQPHLYLHFHGLKLKLKLNTTMAHSCHPRKWVLCQWLIQLMELWTPLLRLSIQLHLSSAAAQLHRISSNIWFLFQNMFMAFQLRQAEERDQQVNLDVFLALVLICFAAYVHVFTFEIN